MLKTPKSPSGDERETHHTSTTADELTSTSRPSADSSTGDKPVRPSATSTAPQNAATELNEVFRLLKNPRRRHVLQLLTETTETIPLGALADAVATREFEKPTAQISSQERKRIYVSLYQGHLPQLAKVGVINYDKPRGLIDRGPTFDQFTRYLPTDQSPTEQAASSRRLLASLSNIVTTRRKLL